MIALKSILLCLMIVKTYQNIDSCQLHWNEVDSKYQCRTLCYYIGICQDFSYNYKSRKCVIYSEKHGKYEKLAGTSNKTIVNEKHKCHSHPCGPLEACVPIRKGKDVQCLKQGCKCEKPESHVKNASLVPELEDHGMTARYQCDKGYAKLAGSDVIKCIGVTWSPLTLACTEIRCGEVKFTSPGLIRVRADYEDTYMSTVMFECDLGYDTEGKGVSVCLQNATWSSPNITCTAITCGTPEGNVSGSYLLSTDHADVYNSTITYDCVDGYVKDGDGISVCQSDGTWLKPNITCSGNVTDVIQAITCGNPDSNFSGSFLKSADHAGVYNSTITYDCVDGYVKDGDGISVCQSDGTWSKPNITCSGNVTDVTQGMQPNDGNQTVGASCKTSPLNITGAYINSTDEDNIHKSRLTYGCAEGYVKHGDGVSVCQSDGTWSKPNIACSENVTETIQGNSSGGCEKPSFKIPNANVNVSSEMDVNVSSLVYVCDGNFSQFGDGVTLCVDGSWSYPNITCIRDGGQDVGEGDECDDNFPKLKLTKATMTSSKYGGKVTYVCAQGSMYYNGSNTSVCQTDGTWTTPTLMCGEWHLWASKVLKVSSQYRDERWHASQILGPYDRFPQYGDNPNSWAGENRICKKIDWIELKFTAALFIRRIEVYETLSAGMVSRISVGSRGKSYKTIWKARSLNLLNHSRIFSPKINKTRQAFDQLKLYINCIFAKSWVEIDAVKIIGMKVTKKQWRN